MIGNRRQTKSRNTNSVLSQIKKTWATAVEPTNNQKRTRVKRLKATCFQAALTNRARARGANITRIDIRNFETVALAPACKTRE
jgi:hypothetical protein